MPCCWSEQQRQRQWSSLPAAGSSRVLEEGQLQCARPLRQPAAFFLLYNTHFASDLCGCTVSPSFLLSLVACNCCARAGREGLWTLITWRTGQRVQQQLWSMQQGGPRQPPNGWITPKLLRSLTGQLQRRHKMLHQQQRHGSVSLQRQNAACRPRQALRRVSCGASARQDISTAAAATAVVTAPTAAADTSVSAEAPFRVTDTTIQDIQNFHQSQLSEYDYVVDASWVSGAGQGPHRFLWCVGIPSTPRRSN
jgi:hypothetical protein